MTQGKEPEIQLITNLLPKSVLTALEEFRVGLLVAIPKRPNYIANVSDMGFYEINEESWAAGQAISQYTTEGLTQYIYSTGPRINNPRQSKEVEVGISFTSGWVKTDLLPVDRDPKYSTLTTHAPLHMARDFFPGVDRLVAACGNEFPLSTRVSEHMVVNEEGIIQRTVQVKDVQCAFEPDLPPLSYHAKVVSLYGSKAGLEGAYGEQLFRCIGVVGHEGFLSLRYMNELEDLEQIVSLQELPLASE